MKQFSNSKYLLMEFVRYQKAKIICGNPIISIILSQFRARRGIKLLSTKTRDKPNHGRGSVRIKRIGLESPQFLLFQ